jgi:hypothetical protein
LREAGGGLFWIKNTYDARSAVEWSQSDAMMTDAARPATAGLTIFVAMSNHCCPVNPQINSTG